MNQADQRPNSVAAPTRFARFRQAPFILQAYVVFVIVASVLGLSVFFARPLHRAIVPYAGANPSVIYTITIYLALAAATSWQRKFVYSIVLLLFVAVGIGCFDMALAWRNPTMLRPFQVNPHLKYATVRPVLTIVVPLAWSLLLLSPVMRKWIKESNQAGAPSRQRQFALIDLLYFTMVVAVCLALSIALVEIVQQKKASLASAPSTQQGASS